ncbi:hypothetical protein CVT24_000304 [Panaeolus cyanescens]|uniref:Uncharacterized protein n=1 Tax=Panaeolus cyanescens TaxID=181874 RepID=A0A409WST7_9AGAR|nr:hypothetical protein CVT24_000304 [Panaeolus cyanescens]
MSTSSFINGATLPTSITCVLANQKRWKNPPTFVPGTCINVIGSFRSIDSSSRLLSIEVDDVTLDLGIKAADTLSSTFNPIAGNPNKRKFGGNPKHFSALAGTSAISPMATVVAPAPPTPSLPSQSSILDQPTIEGNGDSSEANASTSQASKILAGKKAVRSVRSKVNTPVEDNA